MEEQKTLTGKSSNKDVGKSIAGSKANVRVISYYNQLVGSLRGESRPEVLPFREDAVEVSRVSENKIVNPLKDKTEFGWHFEQNVYDSQGIARSVKSGAGSGNIPKVIEPKYDTNDSKPEIGQAMRRYGVKGISPPLNNWSPIITQERKEFREHKVDGEVPTLKQRMGTGGDNVPMVMNTITQAFGRSGCSNEENKSRENVLKANGQLRRLTPRETERLQGFEDNWTLIKMPNGKMMSDTQRYKMMGNAVTVNVIKAIGKKLSS